MAHISGLDYVTCYHVSVPYLWRCRNVNSQVAGTRTLVASPYWAFALELVTTKRQALVFRTLVWII